MATTKEKTRERVIELIENLKPTMIKKLDVLCEHKEENIPVIPEI